MATRRRSYTRRLPYRWRRVVVLLIVILSLVVARLQQERSDVTRPETLAEGVYRVERVVDGDTLLLANQARVRLQGVDTPETVHPDRPVEPFGPEATEFTKRFIFEQGGSVRLRFDKERIDKYDRFLAYVFVGERMLNEELVRAGLATAQTQYRYAESMKRRFRRAEEEAKAAGRGIWGPVE